MCKNCKIPRKIIIFGDFWPISLQKYHFLLAKGSLDVLSLQRETKHTTPPCGANENSTNDLALKKKYEP
jgi:hypothetical protein